MKTTEKWAKICSKLTIKTQERRQIQQCGSLWLTYKQISHNFFQFLLLTLWTNKYRLGCVALSFPATVLLLALSKQSRFCYYYDMFFIGAVGLVHCFFPTDIHLFKFNNGNARTTFEIYSKLTTKTPKQRYRRRSGVFIVTFEQIWNIVIVFPLLTLHKNGLNLLSVP